MKLNKLLPPYFREIKDFKWITEAQELDFLTAEKDIERIQNNFFVQMCDSKMLSLHEQLLDIMPASGESLEFRRERVLNWYNISIPYTEGGFRKRLNIMLGEGNYEFIVEHEQYAAYLNIPVTLMNYHEEILNLVSRMFPAHIAFFTCPVIETTILIDELINVENMSLNYKLGNWSLGEHPFVTYGGEEGVKLLAGKSITETMLQEIAQSISWLPDWVLINDKHEIYGTMSDKVVFDSEKMEASVTVQYTIPENIGLDRVTNIKLAGKPGIFTNDDVDIPVLTDLIMKHKFIVKEGDSNAVQRKN